MALAESNIEEVEARILLHVKLALAEGISMVSIVTNDTSVVVISLAALHELKSQHHFVDIVIEFGMNDSHRKISVTELANCRSAPLSVLTIFPLLDWKRPNIRI